MKSFAKFLLIPLFLSPLVINGCATGQPEQEAMPIPVFPLPPDEARFTYERTLMSSADVEVESDEAAFKRMITGARRTGIGMGKPFGITVHQGRVFVSDTVKRQIAVFDVRNASYFEIGAKEPGELSKPMGLEVDSQGTLYVCDATLKQILVYDRDGKYIRRFGKPQMFDRPSGLTVNPEGDRVFVVDTAGVSSERHRVLVFDAKSGELLHTISKRGNGDGELNLPREAVIGKDGYLYVVDGGNFRVQVFSQDGRFIKSFGEIGRQSGQFSRPKGIGVDPDGNIYVADTAFGNFQIFDPDGQVLLAVGSRNAAPGPARFMLPAGLNVDEDGRVYMVDQYFKKVDVFRPVSLPAEEGWLVYKPKEEE